MMEDKFKKLSTAIDPEISKGKVFTNKDQQQILTRIKRLSAPKEHTKKPLSFIPRILTVALFSGIFFTSYLYFKEVPVPQSQPNVQTKQEKHHVTIDSVSSKGSSALYSPYVDQKQLNVNLRITNISDRTINEKLKYRITFLNNALVEATGTRSFMIEPPKYPLLEPGKTASISQGMVLKKEVSKEDLENAIKVEAISDSKTYLSFVIEKIDYEVEEKKEQMVEEREAENKEESVSAVEEVSEEKVTEAEAKQIFINNLAEIKKTLIKSGEKHNWSFENPATYEIAGPDFEPYVTDRFSKKFLTTFIPKYFCECDQGSLPKVNQEVRFNVDSMEGNRIEISGIEPASDMTNIGYQWNFVLIKEENQWKIDQWRESSLENADLELTKEEAQKLLSTETQTATFIKEEQINGVRAYVFKIVGDGLDTMISISSSDTTLFFDYGEDRN
jgi:hypothetical protein